MATSDGVSTTVSLVRNRMIELIRAQTVGLGDQGFDVLVTDAMIADQRSNDDIIIGDIRDWQQLLQYSRSEGRHKRDESYFVDVNVFTVRQEPGDANDQAIRLWSVVDNLLAAHPDLQLEIPTLVVGKDRRGSLNMTYDESRRGFRARILMQISVDVKIR